LRSLWRRSILLHGLAKEGVFKKKIGCIGVDSIHSLIFALKYAYIEKKQRTKIKHSEKERQIRGKQEEIEIQLYILFLVKDQEP
jgi:hypothetical protein